MIYKIKIIIIVWFFFGPKNQFHKIISPLWKPSNVAEYI